MSGRSLIWRVPLYGATGLCLLGFLGLGAWSMRLPELRGSDFVLWHQIVRVGAALCGTGFAFGTMMMLLPVNRFCTRADVSPGAAKFTMPNMRHCPDIAQSVTSALFYLRRSGVSIWRR